VASASEIPLSEDKEEEVEDEEDWDETVGGDERYERVSQMVAGMLNAGRRALESGLGSGGESGGLRVLHIDELGGTVELGAGDDQRL